MAVTMIFHDRESTIDCSGLRCIGAAGQPTQHYELTAQTNVSAIYHLLKRLTPEEIERMMLDLKLTYVDEPKERILRDGAKKQKRKRQRVKKTVLRGELQVAVSKEGEPQTT